MEGSGHTHFAWRLTDRVGPMGFAKSWLWLTHAWRWAWWLGNGYCSPAEIHLAQFLCLLSASTGRWSTIIPLTGICRATQSVAQAGWERHQLTTIKHCQISQLTVLTIILDCINCSGRSVIWLFAAIR